MFWFFFITFILFNYPNFVYRTAFFISTITKKVKGGKKLKILFLTFFSPVTFFLLNNNTFVYQLWVAEQDNNIKNPKY